MIIPEFTEEDLFHVFFPEENFYLDENGDPVFYLQPGDVSPTSGRQPVCLPSHSLEDILDEL